MGSRAYTIVGSIIDEDDLYRIEHISVHHDCESKGGSKKFCPDCGVLVGETEQERIPVKGYVPAAGENHEGTINGLSIKRVRWRGCSTVFVPSLVCELWNEKVYRLFSSSAVNKGNAALVGGLEHGLAEHRDVIREALEPAGLWNPDLFGVWTVLRD